MNRRMMMGIKEVTPSRLPSEYQEVEYIEGSGTQYLAVPFGLYQESYATELDFQITGSASCYIQGNDVLDIQVDNYLLKTQNLNTNLSARTKLRYALTYISGMNNTRNMYINDVLAKTWSSSWLARSAMYVFRAAGHDNRASMRLYSFKIYQGNDVFSELVPCYRKSDGEVGMYDLATDSFLFNAGTGTFLKGADVN